MLVSVLVGAVLQAVGEFAFGPHQDLIGRLGGQPLDFLGQAGPQRRWGGVVAADAVGELLDGHQYGHQEVVVGTVVVLPELLELFEPVAGFLQLAQLQVVQVQAVRGGAVPGAGRQLPPERGALGVSGQVEHAGEDQGAVDVHVLKRGALVRGTVGADLLGQALDRSRPVLPMMPGIPQRLAHDYVRAGTTTLFAALEVATGKVIGSLHRRHRAEEFKKFLIKLDTEVPAGLEVHLMLDHYATRKTPAIKTWLVAHPAPTCTSPPPDRPG